MKSRKKRIYFETEEVVTTKTKRKGWIEIELDYTQIYNNIASLILHINDKWAVRYLFWIIPQCNENNMIPHSTITIKQFQEWLGKNGFDVIPSIKTIRDAVTELVKNKIFIKYTNNSYQLNPLFIWSDETNKRIEHIKQLGAFEEGVYLVEETTETEK